MAMIIEIFLIFIIVYESVYITRYIHISLSQREARLQYKVNIYT